MREARRRRSGSLTLLSELLLNGCGGSFVSRRPPLTEVCAPLLSLLSAMVFPDLTLLRGNFGAFHPQTHSRENAHGSLHPQLPHAFKSAWMTPSHYWHCWMESSKHTAAWNKKNMWEGWLFHVKKYTNWSGFKATKKLFAVLSLKNNYFHPERIVGVPLSTILFGMLKIDSLLGLFFLNDDIFFVCVLQWLEKLS